jgi:hypothetical protein
MKGLVLGAWALGLLVIAGATSAAVAATATETPIFSNALLVSIDPQSRLVVIKNSLGVKETLELDDIVAGPFDVTAGDRVILTVRGEPGRRRISAIRRMTPTPMPSLARATAIVPRIEGSGAVDTRSRFANAVALISDEARPVDALFAQFRVSCDATVGDNFDGAREWFGLWDGRVRADLASGFCRDLFNQIVSAGEAVKEAMAGAEDVARRTLLPGEIRDLRRLYGMDWDGWTLPPPPRVES